MHIKQGFYCFRKLSGNLFWESCILSFQCSQCTEQLIGRGEGTRSGRRSSRRCASGGLALNGRASWRWNCDGRCDLNSSTEHSFRLFFQPSSICVRYIFRVKLNLQFFFLHGGQTALEIVLCWKHVRRVSQHQLNSVQVTCKSA